LGKFNFQEIYNKGIGSIGSANQLNGITEGFADSLKNGIAKKGLLGCF
jgi:hypothetical protein